jgi:transposase InsO family protein
MRIIRLWGHTPLRFRKTTDSRHTKRIAPNLLKRDFTVPALNRVLAGDITDVATTEGWLYLSCSNLSSQICPPNRDNSNQHT